MKVGIIGSGYLFKDLIESFYQNGDKISFVCVEDGDIVESLRQLIVEKNITLYQDPVAAMSADIILLFDYNRIVDADIFGKTITINLHSGLLPKWRGFSCNAWGVMNGENYLGYTIHRVTNVLDGGGIYYQYVYPFDYNDSFSTSRPLIYKHFVTNIPYICHSILENPQKYMEFDDSEYVYCSRLRKEDSYIRDWNVSTDFLLRKFYFFAPPQGTGLRFIYKGKEYIIKKISNIPGFAKSIGAPGSIVYKKKESIWVKTQDTAISIDEIWADGDIVTNCFKIGNRL